ncbi:S41 family peptidase [Shewanella algae]|uniref:S41 family peptidase n=1 Tax=Shewanella algae TaxID=38313 RepID=UPI000D14F68A|nr:S41 family peptidase [Shewanella algae]PST65249.1 carboxyl-terminal protease [Shewanella algae]TVO90860.1 carboxyl-terminal protease [Shewanella algae]
MGNSIRNLLYIGLGIVMGISLSLASHENFPKPNHTHELSLLLDVMDTVETYYVRDISRRELVDAAIEGIFQHLDPYSSFLKPEQMNSLRDSNRGEYFGYGFEVSTEGEKLRIIAPFPGSPAEQAGIMAGDIVTAVNGESIAKQSLEEVLSQIKHFSSSNRELSLQLHHAHSDVSFEVSLKPATISVHSVLGKMLTNDIGYIRLASFQEDSTRDIVHLLSEWQQQPLNGLILDLRNNPGGLLDQAIRIADLFLDKGRIVATEGRFFDANSDYYASPQTMLTGVPILVLINRGSASASEVLAAALQENNRAKVIGETSFGKGTVQSLIPTLVDGNAIKLTIARYTTPKGQDINAKGVEPDIKIAPNTVSDNKTVPIIDLISPHADTASDRAINSAVAWIQSNK